MAYAEISSHPPLGQLTILNKDKNNIEFTALVEWHKVRPAYPFEFALCYSPQNGRHESQWPCLALRKLYRQPYAFRPAKDPFQRAAFATSINTTELFAPDEKGPDGPVLFTFKYRVSPHSPWKWAGGTAGATVGHLLSRESFHPLPEIRDILDLNDEQAAWHCETLSENEDVRVSKISSAETIEEQSEDLCSGILGRVRSQIRATSIVRLEPYWFGVSSARSFFHLSEDAVLCNFLNSDGLVLSTLAFNSNDKVYTVLRSGPSGELVVTARNDSCDKVSFTILMAVGKSEHTTIKAVMNEARRCVRQRPTLVPLNRLAEPLTSSKNDLFLDGLTFCTWNALGQKLTANKVEAAVQQLSNHGINISSLLIDDNWQSLGPTLEDPNMDEPFFCGFADFVANPAAFPSGLSGLIKNLRRSHPKLENIGVWHALFGYWGGISPASSLAKRYKIRSVRTRLMGETPAEISIIDPSDIHAFYDDFYFFLKNEGIDFVKTDVQHMLSGLLTSRDRHEVIPAYQSAWTHAYLKHFSGRAISCMSQVPEIVLHSLLQDFTPKILLRNSDDYYPEIPASHPWHIFVNAHNSVMTEHLNVIPDWDMFQTAHPCSSYHAAARCISGGPIMITDVPGEHDMALMKQIISQSPTGRTIVLRPDTAKTVGIWERYSDKNVLRIGSTTQTGAALLGLFNLSEDEKHTFFSMSDFPGLCRGAFVVQSYRTKQIFPLNFHGLGEPLRAEDLVHVKLEAMGWDIITASSLLGFSKVQPPVHIAVLGIQGKMSGIAGVVSQSITDSAECRSMTVRLKALGILGIWLSDIQVTVKEAWLMILPIKQKAPDDRNQINISKQDIRVERQEYGGILEVDLVNIFDERNLWQPSDSEEMEVEICIELET